MIYKLAFTFSQLYKLRNHFFKKKKIETENLTCKKLTRNNKMTTCQSDKLSFIFFFSHTKKSINRFLYLLKSKHGHKGP